MQTSEQDGVHLEDFFWTGSGDGPGPVRPISIPPVQGTIVRTATILATVYVDGNYVSFYKILGAILNFLKTRVSSSCTHFLLSCQLGLMNICLQ